MIITYKNQLIKIEKSVLKKIHGYRQTEVHQFEVGGMIIGYRLKSNNSIVINDFTLPLETDSQSKTRFVRSNSHNTVLEQKWYQSQKTIMYLGEWHTHFEKSPRYSRIDIASWKKMMKSAITETEILLFLIAGIDKYKVWIGDRTDRTIQMICEAEWENND